MDTFGGIGLSTSSTTVRRKRSTLNRRPPPESQSPQEYQDYLPSDYMDNAPSDDSSGQDAISRKKELNLKQCISRASYSNVAEAETVLESSDEGGGFRGPNDLIKSTEDDLATANWNGLKMKDDKVSENVSGNQSGQSLDGIGYENKFKKVRLKLGGVTHTIQSKSSSSGSSLAGTSSAKSSNSDAIYPRHKPSHQDNLFKDALPFRDEKGGLSGVPWKDFSKSGFSFGRMGSSRGEIKEADKHGRTWKNKHVYRRSSFDEASEEEEDDVDDEIRYLQKLKTSRMSASHNTEYGIETGTQKLRKISGVMDREIDGYDFDVRDCRLLSSGKESKKSRTGKASEDIDYVGEEESQSEGELEAKRKKELHEPIDGWGSSKSERAISTRQQALRRGRDISLSSGARFVEFPDGLPPAQPRKQKEKLSETEHQLKRAEAAERRRIQNEKAARESEAEAIRKILGQDSSRKRREEKIKKRKEQLAQEKNANAAAVAPDVVRWIIGPSGTTVTFPEGIGLPSIFEPKNSSYPPPREKCAAPSCTNAYKYRDSESNLPLCSLQCYKAIHEKTQPLTAC